MLKHHQETRRKKKEQRKEPITYYELLELEKQRIEQQQVGGGGVGGAAAVKITIKSNFPIASDGFIPNSVVRKFFQLLDTPKHAEKPKVWKLKWVSLV